MRTIKASWWYVVRWNHCTHPRGGVAPYSRRIWKAVLDMWLSIFWRGLASTADGHAARRVALCNMMRLS
jgi:hypothetical protein